MYSSYYQWWRIYIFIFLHISVWTHSHTVYNQTPNSSASTIKPPETWGWAQYMAPLRLALLTCHTPGWSETPPQGQRWSLAPPSGRWPRHKNAYIQHWGFSNNFACHSLYSFMDEAIGCGNSLVSYQTSGKEVWCSECISCHKHYSYSLRIPSSN